MGNVGTDDDVLRFHSLCLKDDEVGCHRGWLYLSQKCIGSRALLPYLDDLIK